MEKQDRERLNRAKFLGAGRRKNDRQREEDPEYGKENNRQIRTSMRQSSDQDRRQTQIDDQSAHL
jgi:hypothetical protein